MHESVRVRPRTFAIVAMGCKVSQYEAQAIGGFLADHLRLQSVDDPRHADVVLIQTCTVTHQSDREARKLVRRIKRLNHACKVIVTGCYAERAPEELRSAGADLVLGHRTPHRLWKIRTFLTGDADGAPAFPEWMDAFGPPRISDRRTRVYLKIHDGCDVFCTFCIIPHVRGPGRSLPPEIVLERVYALIDRGVREIILTGVNLSSYGRDLGMDHGLYDLCRRLDRIDAPVQFRLSSLGAYDLDERLFELVCHSPRFAPHFHLPLQSGSDRVLQDMRRPYTLADYDRIIRYIAAQGTHICIGTDIIVGFPTETEDDFRATLRYIQDRPFAYVHVFPFSPRPGTPAARAWRSLDPRVVHARAAHLRALAQQKREQFYRRQLGRPLRALTLHRMRDGRIRAITGNYIEFAFPDPEGRWPENHWIEVCFAAYTHGQWQIATIRSLETAHVAATVG